MSVVPCRFFGTPSGCRYGDHCKFSHARGPQGNPFRSGMNPFGTASTHQQDALNLAAKSSQNLDAMIEAVKRDMLEWEFGNIFPFSCYGPSGGKPCLPGFEETCAEELRYNFYVVNNRMPPDLTRAIATLQETRNSYKNVTLPIRNILERIIVKGERINSLNDAGSGSAFGAIPAQPSNVFGQSQPTQSTFLQSSPFGGIGGSTSTSSTGNLFGGTAQPASGIFGGSSTFGSSSVGQMSAASNIFGGTSSAFGGQSASLPPSNIFGGGTSTAFSGGSQGASSLFSAAPQTSNIFGGGGVGSPATSGTLFGTPSTAPMSSPSVGSTFGNAGMFGSSPSTNLFSQSPQQQLPAPATSVGNMFSSATTAPNVNIFGSSSPATTPVQSVFGQQQPQPQAQQGTGLFGGTSLSNSLQQQTMTTNPANTGGFPPSPFGTNLPQNPIIPQSTAPTTLLPPSGSFFGSTPQASATAPPASSLFGSQPGPTNPNQEQQFVYTPESELTQEEMEAFTAPYFTLENLPIRPPPRSLCGR